LNSAAVPVHTIRPVDTSVLQTHRFAVNKKPRKVDELKAAYPGKKPAKAVPAPKNGAGGDAEFKRIAGKLLTERKELLHKLAQ
jgi:hypothetical protein